MMERTKSLFCISLRYALVVFFLACNAALAKQAGYISPLATTCVWVFVIIWLGALVASFSCLFLRLEFDEMATLAVPSARKDEP